MKRSVIVVCAALALVLGAHVTASAQGAPDFSGTWLFDQNKSSPGTAGNSPDMPFPTEIVVKQTPTDFEVSVATVRQKPVTVSFKLDGSKVTLPMPSGISETGAAKIDGQHVVITTRRSFASPAGDMVVEFKEIWSVNGNILTIEKTRTSDGESLTAKAAFDKKASGL